MKADELKADMIPFEPFIYPGSNGLHWPQKRKQVEMKFGYPFGMVMPGRSFSSPAYRYGFQGQEKDDEVNGEGNSIYFKFRIHDPRLGRFLSIDPLAADYPHNSPYSFSENSVIAFIELEGLERITVHNSSFAPFDLFGSDLLGRYTGDGEDRKFGVQTEKFRISAFVPVNLATGQRGDAVALKSTSTYVRGCVTGWLIGNYTSESATHVKVEEYKYASGVLMLSFHLEGGNSAALPPEFMAADIDNRVNFSIRKIDENKFRVAGTTNGDAYPSNETYLKDKSDNILMLAAAGAHGGQDSGPYLKLWGDDNARPMGTFSFNIIFNDDETFKGVEFNGTFFDRESWNKQFLSLDPKSSNYTNAVDE